MDGEAMSSCHWRFRYVGAHFKIQRFSFYNFVFCHFIIIVILYLDSKKIISVRWRSIILYLFHFKKFNLYFNLYKIFN